MICGYCLVSHVWFFATPWTVAHQAPLSMGFTRQEHWSGLSFSSPRNLSDPRTMKPACWTINEQYPRGPVVHFQSLLSCNALEGRGVKVEEGEEEMLFTQCNIPPSSGSLPRPCLAFLRGRWDPREDSQSCRVKLHLRRLQQKEEGAGVLAGGSEGLVLTFLLKLFTWGTGALSEHHSSYLHSSVFVFSLCFIFPRFS